ncbi:hypothetical protein BH18ACT8_BH18ACT8_14790 [soil metagenome]
MKLATAPRYDVRNGEPIGRPPSVTSHAIRGVKVAALVGVRAAGGSTDTEVSDTVSAQKRGIGRRVAEGTGSWVEPKQYGLC